MTLWQRCFAIVVVVVALGFRIWALDLKPAHFDEGVNGVLVDEMRQRGFYEYRPENYHGPLHFYVLFAAEQLFGRSLWSLRMPTVLIGTAAVALLFAFRRWMPFRAVGVAAVAMAVSPAMIFYSRYAIHEMWLPFFVLLSLYGGAGCLAAWRGEYRRRTDAWALGLGLAGMVLTKETYIVHWVAAALAVAWTAIYLPGTTHRDDGRPDADALFGRRRRDEDGEATEPTVAAWRRELTVAGAVSAALVVTFYSGFGMHWRGVAGLWETWGHMLFKGFGSGEASEDAHHKETLYYAKLLWHYEWPALIALVAAPLVAFKRSRAMACAAVAAGLLVAWRAGVASAAMPPAKWDFEKLEPYLYLTTGHVAGIALVLAGLGMLCPIPSPTSKVRFLALFGMGSFAAYSLIAYKTPWCMVAALPPLFLVLGWMADRLFTAVGKGALETTMVTGLLAMLFAQPALAAWKLNYRNPTQDGRRYAYVQTTRDIEKLLRPVRELVAREPLNRFMRGYVFGEGHPLHWELADMPNVHFVDDQKSPPSYDADFLLLPMDRVSEVEQQLAGVYFKERYLTRDYGTPGWLYLSVERFGTLFPGREPEFHPRVPLEVPR